MLHQWYTFYISMVYLGYIYLLSLIHLWHTHTSYIYDRFGSIYLQHMNDIPYHWDLCDNCDRSITYSWYTACVICHDLFVMYLSFILGISLMYLWYIYDISCFCRCTNDALYLRYICNITIICLCHIHGISTSVMYLWYCFGLSFIDISRFWGICVISMIYSIHDALVCIYIIYLCYLCYYICIFRNICMCIGCSPNPLKRCWTNTVHAF